MITASGTEKFIQVHETCLTDFIKDFNGCINIMGKEGDLYTVQVVVLQKPQYPESNKENNK